MSESKTEKIHLTLIGMSCGSCAQRIQESLKNVPGVKSATVNFGAKNAEVIYDKSVANPQLLTDSVEHVGYKAEVIN